MTMACRIQKRLGLLSATGRGSGAKQRIYCVPVLDKTRISLRSKHPEVVAARGRVEEAWLDFVLEPTVERCGILNKASFSSVPMIKGEEPMERVRRVQAEQSERQYGEAAINKMRQMRWKRTKERQVEGHSPEERDCVKWFNQF